MSRPLPKLIYAPGMAGQACSYNFFREALGTRMDAAIVQYPNSEVLDDGQYKQLIRDALPTDGSPFILMGESFGSQRCFEVALEQPEGLAGCVFASGFLGDPNPLLTGIGSQSLFAGWNRFKSDPRLAATFHGFERENGIERMTAILDESQNTDPEVLRTRIEIMSSADVPAATLDLQVMLFHARKDRLVTRGAGRRLRLACPQATVYWIDGPHFVLASHPAEIADAVTGFATRL